jgi:hypothetical protein
LIPIVYMSILVSVAYCFDYCRFVVNSEVGKCSFPIFFSFKIVLALQCPLQFRLNLEIGLSISEKKIVG